jgi:hypothetical protein
MKDQPYLVIVTPEGCEKGSFHLEGLVHPNTPCARVEDGSACYNLLIMGGRDRVFVAIRRVLLPIGRFKLVPDDVDKGNPSIPANLGQGGLNSLTPMAADLRPLFFRAS